MKVILAVMCTTWAVVKTRPEKNSGLYGLFSRITSTHLCIQLHVYPANGFNMHSLSDVKRVVFIYRYEFMERTTKQSIERSNQPRTTFNPELKFTTLSEYNLLASTSPAWKGRNFTLMAGIEITLIY